MKWTFGIITSGNSNQSIFNIHRSILMQGIDDDYEIIVVGGQPIDIEGVSHFEFDESIKPGWITKKKNIIAQNASFENICLLHDYVYLLEGWYENFLVFGSDWDVCMNSIVNMDGQRFRDWVTGTRFCQEKDIVFLDYEDHSRTSQMYVSGTYFCVKRDFLIENPIDEELAWGQGEDVEWSERILHLGNCNYKCNPNSKVSLMKLKPNIHWYKPLNKKAREKWEKENGIISEDYAGKNIRQLRDILRFRGLPVSGKKSELISRLQS